ncbi:unnamed protein product [Ectocarpus sp. CCAP 1310/34]|nr:unnamed protein product [Ectocarpus sp. CCAP 1310/34]
MFASYPLPPFRAPSSTTAPAAAAAAAPAAGLNPAQIALAAARNLGVPSALPGQAAGGLSGLGAAGAGGFQANPQLLAQVMRSAQQQAGTPGQFSLPLGAGAGAVPGMLGGMGMGMGDKTVRELFVGNTPQGTSDFVLLEFLNAAMKQEDGLLLPVPFPHTRIIGALISRGGILGGGVENTLVYSYRM